MGKPTGFLDYLRQPAHLRAPLDRIGDWDEFHGHLDEAGLRAGPLPLRARVEGDDRR